MLDTVRRVSHCETRCRGRARASKSESGREKMKRVLLAAVVAVGLLIVFVGGSV